MLVTTVVVPDGVKYLLADLFGLVAGARRRKISVIPRSPAGPRGKAGQLGCELCEP